MASLSSGLDSTSQIQGQASPFRFMEAPFGSMAETVIVVASLTHGLGATLQVHSLVIHGVNQAHGEAIRIHDIVGPQLRRSMASSPIVSAIHGLGHAMIADP